jgi:hypothetical protein
MNQDCRVILTTYSIFGNLLHRIRNNSRWPYFYTAHQSKLNISLHNSNNHHFIGYEHLTRLLLHTLQLLCYFGKDNWTIKDPYFFHGNSDVH